MNKLALASLVVASAICPVSALAADGGVRGLDHVALTIPDMAQARAFMQDGLGCRTVFDLGPFKDDSGTWMQDYIGTHPRAVMNIAVMNCGNTASVELMEISSPSQNKTYPQRDDLGAASLGFYVDDLEASLERVAGAGGEVLGGVTNVDAGPEAGRKFAYVRAPWGQLFFLLNDGEGIAYDEQPHDVPLPSPRNLPPSN